MTHTDDQDGKAGVCRKQMDALEWGLTRVEVVGVGGRTVLLNDGGRLKKVYGWEWRDGWMDDCDTWVTFTYCIRQLEPADDSYLETNNVVNSYQMDLS